MAQLLILILIVLLASLFVGSPVFTSMGFTAVFILLVFMGSRFIHQFGLIAFLQGTSPNQLIAPMFIMMAEFLSRGSIAEDIYFVLNKYLRKLKGGLALSTTLACTIFAALCGSSPATAAAIGRISVDQMIKRGYRKDFAVGTVAGGGTLGIMIPPSVTLVGYGIITETSIAKLLIAGLLPGIMLSLFMCVSIMVRTRLNPALIGEIKVSVQNRLHASGGTEILPAANRPLLNRQADCPPGEAPSNVLQDMVRALPPLFLIVVVLGAMYTGMATPTECAGIGVIGAVLILAALRRLTAKIYKTALMSAAKIGTMIIFMMIAGFCLSYVVSYLGIATKFAEIIVTSGTNRWFVMVSLYVLWFVLGCLMDPSAMIILTVPFVFPTLTAMGFDPIWIGIVSTLSVEIGMITPPVGLNLFVLRSSTDVPMKDIITGTFPYVAVLLAGLIVLNIFPAISLLLPSLM
ncbi:MAG: TRAP transporter large permease [Clostridiales Family XIII bacterium]|nr:TRAP transporter large permease [Clostridiales Family XIII bacterium]